MTPIRMAAILASLALGLVSALAQSPQANPVADALQRWGLIGTWSLDCSRPPGGTHIRCVVWLGGKAMTERDYGDASRDDSNEVTSATINPDGSRDRPDRVRALWNRGPGVYSVKDGRFTANGSATPWQYKCS